MTRKKWTIIAVGFLLAVLAVVGTSGFRLTEIDINTGRLRSSLYVFCGVRVGQEVRETEFSKLVAEYGLAQEPPVWKPALRATFGFYYLWTSRICYTYNGVFAQLRLFDEVLRVVQPNPEMRKEAVTEIVGYMQRDDPEMAANRMDEILREWLK